MSKITDFYSGIGTDAAGRTLEEILSKSNEWLEACHDYIQMVFPLRIASHFNPDAPLLSDEDVTFFKENFSKPTDVFYNFFKMVDKFLYFMGIQDVWYFNTFDGFELADNFEKQKYTWLEFNHNALRITRMLKCLSILGLNSGIEGSFSNYAVELLNFMKSVAAEKGIEYGGNRLAYWEDALKGDNSVL